MAETAHSTEPIQHQIMVVDDDASVRDMLVRVMMADGYTAWAAADGTEALRIAASVKLDLVLLDLGLPRESGWDVFESLTLKTPSLAIIVITARPGQAEIADVAGANAFFEKPLDFPTLLGTVRRLLAEPPAARRARPAGRSVPWHALRCARDSGTRKNL